MNHPLVSVIMCTYNGEQFLNEQISSVIQQDYPNMELVIVDDHSTDGTWNILQDWKEKTNFIRIYQNKENLGYNTNFNNAIQLAAGEFISLCDQDDIWLPKKISRTMQAFSSEDTILAHCKSVRLEDGELKFHLAQLHYHFSGSDTRRLFLFNQVMGHDMIFRKKLVERIIPIPESMSYDWWIAVVATCNGEVAAVEEYLVHHRIHATNSFFSSVSASKKKENDLDQTLEIFKTIPELHVESRRFLEEFLGLLKQHQQKENIGIDLSLFLFFWKNRRIFFGHKRRKLPALSYLKNSVKYAGMDYRNRGISI